MNWFKNMVRFAREQAQLKEFSQGYEYASAHLIRTNGLSDPRDFMPENSNRPFDKGVRSAVEDFLKILECESQCSGMRSVRIKQLTQV